MTVLMSNEETYKNHRKAQLNFGSHLHMNNDAGVIFLVQIFI